MRAPIRGDTRQARCGSRNRKPPGADVWTKARPRSPRLPTRSHAPQPRCVSRAEGPGSDEAGATRQHSTRRAARAAATQLPRCRRCQPIRAAAARGAVGSYDQAWAARAFNHASQSSLHERPALLSARARAAPGDLRWTGQPADRPRKATAIAPDPRRAPGRPPRPVRGADPRASKRPTQAGSSDGARAYRPSPRVRRRALDRALAAAVRRKQLESIARRLVVYPQPARVRAAYATPDQDRYSPSKARRRAAT